MSEGFEHEKFVINNPDGSISLDAYAGKSRDELKKRCGELCRALSEWQMIAMLLATHGRDGLESDDLERVDSLIEAYMD